MKLVFKARSQCAVKFLEKILKKHRVGATIKKGSFSQKNGFFYQLFVKEEDHSRSLNLLQKFGEKQKPETKVAHPPPLEPEYTIPENAIEESPEVEFDEYVLIDEDIIQNCISDKDYIEDFNHNAVNMLIVDDNIDLRKLLRFHFDKSQFGNDIFEATNGLEAFEIVKQFEQEDPPVPYVMLLDLYMPRMTGLEFLKKYRETYPKGHSAIFMFSSSVSEEDKAKANQLGIAGFISKNNCMNELSQIFDMLKNYCHFMDLS